VNLRLQPIRCPISIGLALEGFGSLADEPEPAERLGLLPCALHRRAGGSRGRPPLLLAESAEANGRWTGTPADGRCCRAQAWVGSGAPGKGSRVPVLTVVR
jgi:hypothetical protein